LSRRNFCGEKGRRLRGAIFGIIIVFLKKGTAGFSEGGAEAAFQPGTFSGTVFFKNRLTFEISRLKLRSLAG
jgi:hypothetical protein